MRYQIAIASYAVVLATTACGSTKLSMRSSVQKANSTDTDEATATEPFPDIDWQASAAVRVEDELVQAHFPLPKAWIDRPEFLQAATILQSIESPLFVTRHVKGGDEGPWWNTSVGERYCSPKDPKCAREPAGEILKSHEGKQRVLAYYRNLWEQSYAVAHPDWICVDELGKPQTFKGGQFFLSLNSPYRDIVRQRLVELAKMGYSALFFDFKHQPEKGCWDPFSRSKFKAATELEAPLPGQVGLANPVEQRFIQFHNAQIAGAFSEWRAAVRKINPNIQFIISLSYAPSLTSPHLNTAIINRGDLSKTEFRLPTVVGPSNSGAFYRLPANSHAFDPSLRMAFGYSMIRNASFDKPAHVWLNIDPLKAKSGEYNRGIAAIIGLGGIANVMISDLVFKNRGVASLYKSAFSASRVWTSRLKSMTSTKPYAGVFFSEKLRWTFATNQDGYWTKGNIPSLAAFETLSIQGIPSEVIVDQTLEQGLPLTIKTLLMPYRRDLLSIDQQRTIKNFEENGGKVVDFADLDWHANSYAKSASTLTSRISYATANSYLRVVFPSGTKQRVFTVYTKPVARSMLTLTIPKDFSWAGPGAESDGSKEDLSDRNIVLKFPKNAPQPLVRSAYDTSRSFPATRDTNGAWQVRLPAFGSHLGMFEVDLGRQ